ncbi:porin [Aliigemmobacter aestuarii]|nr:porin [Gemmobacter aestuarii]
MKKILLASTALVGFAGAAAAEVSLSGYAEMGIAGGDAVETQFWNEIDVTFTLSGETDGGLQFGATIDLDEVTNAGNVAGDFDARDGGPDSVFISGSFGKVTLGDTDGAYDWALTEVYMGTALADDHSTHAGSNGNSGLDGTYDGQVMRYEYSFGDFAAALSAELDDTGVNDAVIGLGFKWGADMGGTTVNVGLGYQTDGTTDIIGVSAHAALSSGLDLRLNYADLDVDEWMGLGIGYTSGALLVQANYGEYDSGADGFGLVVNYDLGGGAVVMAGYGSGNGPAGNGHGDDTFSLGLGLSF